MAKKKLVAKSKSSRKAKVSAKSVRTDKKKKRTAKAKLPRRSLVEAEAKISVAAPPKVELQSVSTFFELVDGQPTLQHKRRFTNTSSDQVIFLLMGMKFYGPGGLMVSSLADSEECSPSGTSREITNFRPLGRNPSGLVAGSFSIRQDLVECYLTPNGLVAGMQMSFTPTDPDGPGPFGSLLWWVEPDRRERMESRTCWSDLINCEETVSRNVPALRVKAGSAEILMQLHNRLIGGAAKRVAEVLNAKPGSEVVYADYVRSGRLDFLSTARRG